MFIFVMLNNFLLYSNNKYYLFLLLETIILTLIIMIFCFEFKISYNEMDVFTYAKASYENGLNTGWYKYFQFPANFLFNWTLGLFMFYFNPFKVILIGRILSYILISQAFIYLSRTLKLTFLTSVLTFIIFIYFFKSGIGAAGEWIVGGLESKVFAYSFAIFSLSSFLRKKNRFGFLFAGLAISTHLLIGIYNLFCLMPIIFYISYRKKLIFFDILKSIPYFILTGIIGISEILNSFCLNTSQIIQDRGWDIYTQIRVPHHLIPNFSKETWAIIIVSTIINLIFISNKNKTIKYIALYCLFSILIIIPGFIIYYFYELHYLRFYFFRFCEIMMPLLTLLLIATINHKIKFVTLFLILATIILPSVIQERKISKFLSLKSYNINLIKNKTDEDKIMTEWINSNTMKDDIFIISPEKIYFCMNTEREVFISWWMLAKQNDYKSVENIPTEMIEWYNRLHLLNLNNEFTTLSEVKKNYLKLDEHAILDIQKTYKSVKYILMPSYIELDFPIAIKTEKQILYSINM